ncbi:BolA family protein [Gynuella sunshinyii]|uniref:Stress-induced morphogen n=1 Tax=Gynuella sunshinyii YC6258 TaxID=1445510 RepID=A0A0C5VLN6_9GAMM|nr:BolA/IbaG family iron-sulfur metabolism protein [Gynuella sunshinyii]AJQ95201.1 stress-induced morphogen (activity unknown) [Gynuella sunshinyii YC6258]
MSIQQRMRSLLEAEFSPVALDLINESHMHSVPDGSESHFKLVLVSDLFTGLPKVKRHQLVYKVLAELLAGPVHALAMHLYTKEEWGDASTPDSPQCMGGSKSS